MPRSRNIKYQFFGNEYLSQVSAHARLLFIALWCLADCKGRLEDRPLRIKAFAFPYELVDIEPLLNELATSPQKFIVRYQIDGIGFIEIPNFSVHQRPSSKEKEAGSRIPAPNTNFVPGTHLGHNGDVPRSEKIHPGDENFCPEDEKNRPGDDLITDVLITDLLNTDKPEDDASASVCVSGLEKIISDGYAYLLATEHPHLCSSPSWAKTYLAHMLPVLCKQRPDLPHEQLLSIWRDAIDSAIQKKIWAANWIKKAFEGRVNSAEPAIPTEPPKTHALADLSSQAEALLKFSYIRHLHMVNCWWKSEELEIRPESPSGLSHKKTFDYYPVGHLEGLMEEPEYAEL